MPENDGGTVAITQLYSVDGWVIWLLNGKVIQAGKIYEECPIVELKGVDQWPKWL